MNIVYLGSFLKEGLAQLGHTAIDLPPGGQSDINNQLEALGCPGASGLAGTMDKQASSGQPACQPLKNEKPL